MRFGKQISTLNEKLESFLDLITNETPEYGKIVDSICSNVDAKGGNIDKTTFSYQKVKDLTTNHTIMLDGPLTWCAGLLSTVTISTLFYRKIRHNLWYGYSFLYGKILEG